MAPLAEVKAQTDRSEASNPPIHTEANLTETKTTQARAKLCELPAELLLRILQHVVQIRKVIYGVELADPDQLWRRRLPGWNDDVHSDEELVSQPAITQTNRDLRNLALQVYYRVNHFFLINTENILDHPYPLLRFRTPSTASHLRFLRRVDCCSFVVHRCPPGQAYSRIVALTLAIEPRETCISVTLLRYKLNDAARQEWDSNIAKLLNILRADIIDGHTLLRLAVLVDQRGFPFSDPESKLVRAGLRWGLRKSL